MSNPQPWNDIKTPKSDYNVRKIKASQGLPLFWGKDTEGRCLFIYELAENGYKIFQDNHVAIHGMDLDYRKFENSDKHIVVLTLEKHIDRDLFYNLCCAVVQELDPIEDPLVGLSVLLTQLKRWKAFLAAKKQAMLSPQEVRGLFAELQFLGQLMTQSQSEYEALEAWQGSEKSHQDFMFSNTAVEVKALSGQERNTVRISSEDQLETLNNHLYLKLFRLITNAQSQQGLSLNELVKQVEARLTSAESIDLFYEKLALVGYFAIPAYDKPKFIVAEELTYKVGASFPKIVRSNLTPEFIRVSYELKLESIHEHLCSAKEIWEYECEAAD